MIEQGYEPAFSVKSGQAWKMSTAGTERSEAYNAKRRAARCAVEVWFEVWSGVFRLGGSGTGRRPADREAVGR